MMKGLRTAGQTWLGKTIIAVMFGFLIVSFAIWGINDIFRGAQRVTVAKVGDVEITADQYRSTYQAELQQLIRRTRQSITPQQARAMGLDSQILSRMVTEATLDRKARDLGLTVSDQLVVRSVTDEPGFKGPNGQFDRSRFDLYLGERGLSEAGFVREHHGALVRAQLADAITGALQVPVAAREAVHRYGAERRAASYFILPAAGVGDIPAPTDGELQAFFNERKSVFRSPEYRAVNVVTVTPETLAKPDAVSDDDARKRYEQTKARFGAPERRTVEQIVFPNAEAAAAAAQRIREGATFDQIAAEKNIDPKNLELGTFAKSEMIDPAVADAAFGLAPGQASGPVQGRFVGTVLLRVTNVEPERVKPFEEVAAEVKREIALERAKTAIEDVHDKVEDQRASARPLPDIARENGLQVVAVPAIDRSGKDKAGNPVANLPERDAVLAAAFGSDVGVDNEALRTRNGGYVWFEVTGIEPARDKTLAETRGEVAAQWRAEEVSRRLAEKARGFVERLEKGEAVEAVAAEAGAEAKTAADLARRSASGELSTEVVNRIFSVPVGRAASADAGNGRAVFKVTAATVPPFVTTTQEAGAVADQMRLFLQDDLVAEYVKQAQQDLGLRINQDAARRAIAGGGES
ncbi:MAG TPA: peptidyl-prolyl cis-trans isomerase [Beijerinckiaceae bacterium]|jgi:peptidyl-prolyl cis-trans isomerase D